MATGIMSVSPAPFVGALAETLPTYQLPVPPLAVEGATGIYDAATLLGNTGDSIASWASVGGVGPTLTPAGGGATSPTAPTLVFGSDGAPALRFDRTSKQTLGAAFVANQPRTLVSVARMTSYAGTTILEGILGSGPVSDYGQIQTITGAGIPRTYAGASLNLTGSSAAGGWHVFISVFSGTSSVIRMDGAEAIGAAGALNSGILSVASYLDIFSSIEVKKVINYPFALTLAQRNTLTTALKTQYGI